VPASAFFPRSEGDRCPGRPALAGFLRCGNDDRRRPRQQRCRFCGV